MQPTPGVFQNLGGYVWQGGGGQRRLWGVGGGLTAEYVAQMHLIPATFWTPEEGSTKNGCRVCRVMEISNGRFWLNSRKSVNVSWPLFT